MMSSLSSLALLSTPIVAGVLAFAAAMVIAFVLTPLTTRVAARFRMFDTPDGQRRMHASPVPRVGGVAVFLSVLLTLGILWGAAGAGPAPQQGPPLYGLVFGASLMFIVGLVDDVRGLPPAVKIAGQVTAAVIALASGFHPTELALGYGAQVHIGWLGIPLMLLWVVAVTNAYNLIDGLNGLATGIAVVACIGAAVSAMVLDRVAVMVPLFALGGALVGFLRHNFPKAKIFLGDSGTMSIGFLLSVLLVRAASTAEGAVIIPIPMFALVVPFLDTSLAIMRRWLRNVPLSGADARHIHHRLLALGMSPTMTVVTLWAIAAAFMTYGLLASLAPPVFAGAVSAFGVLVLAVVVIYATNLLSYYELRVARDVLFHGASRARQVISDQIMAMDLCQSIRDARSLREIDMLLRGGASTFGFLHMELHSRELAADAAVKVPDDVVSKPIGWRLDFFVYSNGSGYPWESVLSIWCDANSSRPLGAERIARTLAPAIATWLERNDAQGHGNGPVRDHTISVLRRNGGPVVRAADGHRA